uniref:28S rRNA (uridine-N(3))-methyltransferase n=1 Tax=Homo sapiens TaxID=9606 RepID=Q9P041_HUMAN|nr:HSPC109 [Homo sapiens]
MAERGRKRPCGPGEHGQRIEWRKWKQQKKEEKKKWKDLKLMKKLERQRAQEEQAKRLEEEEAAAEKEDRGRPYTLSVALPGSILTMLSRRSFAPTWPVRLPEPVPSSVWMRSWCLMRRARMPRLWRGNSQELEEGAGVRTAGPDPAVPECPQYLRKAFFPKHQDLQFAGLLNPLDSPHHMRQDEESEFREGIVVDRPTRPGHGSFVNCGMKKEVKIDKNLEPGLRVTVRLNQQQHPDCKTYHGKVVSSQDPRTKAGLYWGYTVRLASCLSAVFAEAPFQDGYDLTIGTSERGSDVASASFPTSGMLLWCSGASRVWKLERMLTPTWRWLNPVSSLTCTSIPVLARVAVPSARRKPSSSPWPPCSLASPRRVPGTPESSKGPRTSVKQQ